MPRFTPASELPAPATRSRWSLLIEELMARGYSQSEIARACACDQTGISKLFLGQVGEPRHSLGERLLALHRRTT